MNITLTGTKIMQDTKFLAFEKNNGVDVINITVDTDDSWSYKLDVKYPEKCCTGEELFNTIDLPMDASRTCTIDVTAAMVPLTGKYTMQLRGISGDKVYSSDIFEAWVKYSIEPGSTYDPVPSEFYQIEAKLDDKVNEAKQYAENAEIASTRMPKISSDNTWLIWDVGTSDYVDTGIKASGADGKDGVNATIISATVSVDENIGTPEAEVTLGGTESARTFNFAFKNLKGASGAKGDPFTYDDFTPEQLESLRGPAGKDGQDGKNGISVTHKWDGTILEVTSASGTSSADLKGEKGDPFVYEDFTPEQLEALRGPQGIPGPAGSDASVTAENIQSALGYTPANSNEVGQIKEDLSAKIDKPDTAPEVGKILKVLSVKDDGTFTCEWAYDNGGAVDDVQLNDKSIVQDGVAKIPSMPSNASMSGEIVSGMIRLNGAAYCGLSVPYAGAYMRLAVPSRDNIDQRSSSSFPLAITLSTLDYAVKAAMCDGKGTAWTDAEKTAAWKRFNSIKTEMDEITVAGAQYYLGAQTAVSVVLPDDAEVGQMVTVSWYNGATAATLSITGTMLSFDYTPSANTRSEINALWDGTYWAVLGNEMAVVADA